MKPTRANIRAIAVLRETLRVRPEFAPESTTTGKVHGGFGVLCAFTDRAACEETLRELGFVALNTYGSFTEWTRRAAS